MAPLGYGRVQEIADTTWRSVQDLYQPNTCVLGTRVLGDVLEALGIKRWKPVALTAVLMNEAAARHATQHNCMFDGYECGTSAPNSKIVVLGGGTGTVAPFGLGQQRWRGHLGALVEGQYLVDISASQGSYPDHGLVIAHPLVTFVPKRWQHGGVWAIENWLYGARLHYLARPDVTEWRDDFDWYAATSVRQALVAATLARLRGEYYEYPDTIKVILKLTGRR